MRPAVSDQPVSNLNVSPRRRPPARAAPRRARRHRGPARLDPARRGGRLRAPLAPRAGDARGGDRRWPYAAGPRPEADVMRRRLAVAAFLALPAVAWAQERKTLAECIEIGLRQQPTLRAAAATVAAGRERVWQAAAAYLPQVSASYLASRRHASSSSLIGSGGLGKAKTFPFYTTGATISQVLFDFGQNLELIHAARASAEALAADADTQHDTVVFNVQQAYFMLLAAYRLRDVAEETVVQNQKHLDLAEGRHDVGLAPRIDITTAQVQLAQAELNQLTARNNVSLGRETLRNTLGLAGPLDFDIVDSLEQARTEVSDEEALDLAYANRPELRSLAAQERDARGPDGAAQPAPASREHRGRGQGSRAGAREPLAGRGPLQDRGREHHRADRCAGGAGERRGEPRAGAGRLPHRARHPRALDGPPLHKGLTR